MKRRSISRSIAAIIAAAAVVFTTAAATPFSAAPSEAWAASGPAESLSRPWSERSAATGDYIYDSYDNLPQNHVFENVTTDRLLDILSSNGNYYIVFAGPEHEPSQKILAEIDARAKAASPAVTKIYHFDPWVDGYQLDITQKNGKPDVTGGTSVNFGGTSKLSDVWKLITGLLPAASTQSGGALYDYDGRDTLLLNVKITDRGNPESGKQIISSYKLTHAAAAAGGFSATSEDAAIDAVLSGGAAAQRSEFEFFKRLYNGSASFFESKFAAGPDRIGSAVTIFSDADYPGGAGFVLDSVDVKELYDILNTPGEALILFAGQGCHNTQAIIGTLAKRAKQLGSGKIYVADLALDSNVKFGTGADIDKVLNNGPTSGLWIRNSSIISTSPYRYGYTYLYGYLAQYLGNSFVTQDSSRKTDSIPYFINGNLGGASTVSPYYDNGAGAEPRYVDDADFTPATDTPNAKRLQVPALLRYKKNSAGAAGTVTAQWLHKNNGVYDAKKDTYTEYMLELAWVRASAAAKADTSRSAGRDGLSKTEFAAEAVQALDGVLKSGAKQSYRFSASPAPVILGGFAIGRKLSANAGDWSHDPSFTYKWYANGAAIPGATSDSYTTKASDAGKRITLSVTGTRAGYAAVTKTSAPTNPIGNFTKSPVPSINGSAKLGVSFGLNWGTWAPWPAGSKFTYQWYRNGTAISGATKNTYEIVIADIGKKITASVTATAPGYVKTTRVSKPTAAVKAYSFSKSPAPKISGTAKVGRTLKVKVGTWSPKPKFTYRWYANGKLIKGAVKASFKLKKAQKGKRITVKVTAAKSGYEKVSKVSKATAKVKK